MTPHDPQPGALTTYRWKMRGPRWSTYIHLFQHTKGGGGGGLGGGGGGGGENYSRLEGVMLKCDLRRVEQINTPICFVLDCDDPFTYG